MVVNKYNLTQQAVILHDLSIQILEKSYVLDWNYLIHEFKSSKKLDLRSFRVFLHVIDGTECWAIHVILEILILEIILCLVWNIHSSTKGFELRLGIA